MDITTVMATNTIAVDTEVDTVVDSVVAVMDVIMDVMVDMVDTVIMDKND